MSTSTQVMTLYLNEAGSYPRLSVRQEQELAAQVALGRIAQRKLRQTSLPSVQRCKALQNEVARDQAAQRRRLESNLRLVVYWARLGTGLPRRIGHR